LSEKRIGVGGPGTDDMAQRHGLVIEPVEIAVEADQCGLACLRDVVVCEDERNCGLGSAIGKMTGEGIGDLAMGQRGGRRLEVDVVERRSYGREIRQGDARAVSGQARYQENTQEKRDASDEEYGRIWRNPDEGYGRTWRRLDAMEAYVVGGLQRWKSA
jgi:hypothetical protein